MTQIQTRQRVVDFLDAFYAGDATRLEACCHDDLDSIVYAPISLFPHLGHHRGKAWAAHAVRVQEERYSSRSYDIRFIAVDGPKAAVIVQVALQKRSDQRMVRLDVAEFFTLQDGLIAEHRSFVDSFDLVQQVIGRDLSDTYVESVRAAMGSP